jgi:hypothetical protein
MEQASYEPDNPLAKKFPTFVFQTSKSVAVVTGTPDSTISRVS